MLGIPKTKMRTAADVVGRILHDPELDVNDFRVGYIDRFVGILEKPFSAFKWIEIIYADLHDLSIPEHRIAYFKYRNVLVWDKESRLDKVFGSSNSEERMTDVVERVAQQEAAEALLDAADDGKKKSKRKGKKKLMKDDEKKESSESSDSEEEEEDNNKRFGRQNDRPNMFVSIPITNLSLIAKIVSLQEHVVSLDSRMEPGLSFPTSLHVTLLTLRVDNKEQRLAAIRALQACRQLLHLVLPREVELSFLGLTTFRHRVLVTSPQETDRVTCLVNGMIEIFTAEAHRMIELGKPPFKLIGNRDKYTPHVTIAKLTRPMIRDGIDEINFYLYKKFINDSDVNSSSFLYPSFQNASQLCLCDMARGTDFYGYYPCHATVINDFSVLLTACSDIQMSDKLVLNLSHVTDDGLEGLCKLMFEGRDPSSKHLIVARGIPGCGKTFISEKLSEFLMKTRGMKCYIACADDERIIDGEYKFEADQSEAVHSRSIQKAIDCMLNQDFQVLIACNTNSKDWEYAEYSKLAHDNGWPVTVLQHHVSNCLLDSDYIGSFNTHKVPQDTVFRMTCRFMPEMRDEYLVPGSGVRVIRFTVRNQSQSSYSVTGSEMSTWLSGCVSSSSIGFSCVSLASSCRKTIRDLIEPKFPNNIVMDYVTLRHKPDYLMEPFDTMEGTSLQLGARINGATVELKADNEVEVLTAVLSSDGKSPIVDSGAAFVVISMDEGVKRSKCKEIARDASTVGISLVSDISGELSFRLRIDDHDIVACDVQQLRGFRTADTSSPIFWLPWEVDRNMPSSLSSSKLNFPVDSTVSRVVVIDFDLCLVMTPDPPKPFKGDYLSLPESLSLQHNYTPNRACFQLLRRAFESSNISGEGFGRTAIVLLTGRQSDLEPEVRRILRLFQVDLMFDHLILKPKLEQMPTCDFKVKIVDQLVLSDKCVFPNTRHLIIIDDDQRNLEEYVKMHGTIVKPIRVDIIDAVALEQSFASLNYLPSGAVENYLSSVGHHFSYLSSPEIIFARSFIRHACCQVLKTVESNILVVPTGSFILGKSSCDLDMCAFCLNVTHVDYGFLINRLSSQLSWNNSQDSAKKYVVCDMRVTSSAKRPRLSFNLLWKGDDLMQTRYDIPSVIEVDFTFCFLQYEESLSSVRAIHELVERVEHNSITAAEFMDRSSSVFDCIHQITSQLSSPLQGTLAYAIQNQEDFNVRYFVGWLSNWHNLTRMVSVFGRSLDFLEIVKQIGACITLINKVFQQYWCSGLPFGLTYRNFILADVFARFLCQIAPETGRMNADTLTVKFMLFLKANGDSLSWKDGSRAPQQLEAIGRHLEVILSALNRQSPIVSPYLEDLVSDCINRSFEVLSANALNVATLEQLMKPVSFPGPIASKNGVLTFKSSLNPYNALVSFQGRVQQVVSFLVYQKNLHLIAFEKRKNEIGLAFFSGRGNWEEVHELVSSCLASRELHQDGLELFFQWITD